MKHILFGSMVALFVFAIVYNRFYANRCPRCGSSEIYDLSGDHFGCMEPGCRGATWTWKMWQRYRRLEK
jgi:predicted nucleic-acid-binding Zn-ribbon protein